MAVFTSLKRQEFVNTWLCSKKTTLQRSQSSQSVSSLVVWLMTEMMAYCNQLKTED